MPRTATVRKLKPAAAAAIAIPKLAKGERYVGAVIGADGKGHHVILLAGDEEKTWKDALAWAQKKGGDLPDRVEQALLFRDHKGEFQETWYWSNTTNARSADYAWSQSFGNGYQYGDHKDGSYRCRAVRRVAI